MNDTLPCGIPPVAEYSRLLKSQKFAEIEDYSNRFLVRHHDILEPYAKKWVPDPLHQWSRQWEYPFVLDQLSDYCQITGTEQIRVLDAGSGLTFFPYMLTKLFKEAVVNCCDYDPELEAAHKGIAGVEKQASMFKHSALDKTSYADDTFDFIYCISVMEHTDNYRDIVTEFRRIIKPGGRLIVTFDISIDGMGDISPPRAKELCAELGARFNSVSPVETNFDTQIQRQDIVTTLYAASLSLELLPWKSKPKWTRQIESLFRRGRLIAFPPPFTFCCLSLQA